MAPTMESPSPAPMVTWRRAQMVLLSAQGMDVEQIAKVALTSADRVRDLINNFNETSEALTASSHCVLGVGPSPDVG